MQVELSDATYKLLELLSQQRGDASPAQTLDHLVLQLEQRNEEAQRIRAQVDEVIRSAEEEPLVDGEAFFEWLRQRRAHAA